MRNYYSQFESAKRVFEQYQQQAIGPGMNPMGLGRGMQGTYRPYHYLYPNPSPLVKPLLVLNMFTCLVQARLPGVERHQYLRDQAEGCPLQE